ncbi:MAG: DUF6265 family protein [Planctomycetota bacterium]
MSRLNTQRQNSPRHQNRSNTTARKAAALVLLVPAGLLTLGAAHATSAATATTHAQPQVASHPLDFITGSYTGSLGGGTMPCEEYWTPVKNGHMLGVFRLYNPQGELMLTEHMTMSLEGDDPTAEDAVTFRLRHFTPEMQPWATEAEGPIVAKGQLNEDGCLVLDAEDNGSEVKQFIYEPHENGGLQTTIDSEPDGPLVIPFTRMR